MIYYSVFVDWAAGAFMGLRGRCKRPLADGP